MPIDRNELATRFAYHSPKKGQTPRYEAIRYKARGLAMLIIEQTPESREQSLAVTKLEEAVFWANAAIARREVASPPEDEVASPSPHLPNSPRTG